MVPLGDKAQLTLDRYLRGAGATLSENWFTTPRSPPGLRYGPSAETPVIARPLPSGGRVGVSSYPDTMDESDSRVNDSGQTSAH